MPQDLYCRAAFKGLFVALEADQRARISACCINDLGPKIKTIDFEGDPRLQLQRHKFLNGDAAPGCRLCWSKESRGLISRRQTQGRRQAGDSDPFSIELRELNYQVSPLCNARCITCNSSLSSSWAQEDLEHGTLPQGQRVFNMIRHSDFGLFGLDLSQVELVYFNGGEPLLSRDPSRVLAEILAQQGTLKNLTLSITTNASTPPRPEDLELWNQCGSVTLVCSIEAVGAAFEYTRWPLKWAQVAGNIDHLAQSVQVPLKILFTPNIGVHNALEYPRLAQWHQSLRLPVNHELKPGLTYGHLSLDTTSEEIKAAMLDRLGPEYTDIRNMIMASTASNDHAWRTWLNEIDRRRYLHWPQWLTALADIAQK